MNLLFLYSYMMLFINVCSIKWKFHLIICYQCRKKSWLYQFLKHYLDIFFKKSIWLLRSHVIVVTCLHIHDDESCMSRHGFIQSGYWNCNDIEYIFHIGGEMSSLRIIYYVRWVNWTLDVNCKWCYILFKNWCYWIVHMLLGPLLGSNLVF